MQVSNILGKRSGLLGKRCLSSLYDQYQKEALSNPTGFWGKHAENLVWDKKWDKVVDTSNPPFTKWFSGGWMNMCYNCVDRHVDSGNGEKSALIWDSPVTNSPIRHMSYNELQDKVSKLARCLVKMGVEPGDRVLIYMPMILEGAVAMLACARIGAIHNVVFGGFASKELSVRIDASKPRVIIAGSNGVMPGKTVQFQPIIDKAMEMSTFKPQYTIYKNRSIETSAVVNGKTVLDFDELLDSVSTGHDCVSLPADHPLYLLYTSGTTGTPKAVQRNAADYATVLLYTMKNEFDLNPDEVWFSATDYGWVVGHSYCVYAPLLSRNPSIIFEGKPVGTPDASTIHRILSEHDVRSAFASPSIMRILCREEPEGTAGDAYPRPNFGTMFLAGERCDIGTLLWVRDTLKLNPVDHYWQTESGTPILMPPVALGEKVDCNGSAGKSSVGNNILIVDDQGNVLPDGEFGQIVAKLPLRPGFFPTLFQNDSAYAEKYFTDFPAIAHHELISECAVVGQDDPLMGERPLGFVVMTPGSELTSEITKEVIKLVRDHIGPHTGLQELLQVERLPKTISQKILRNMMVAIVNNKPYKVSPTIDDPTVVGEIVECVESWREGLSN
ncbi:acyl-CoA synthetase short-chain family member 3, mitochondrial-like isoform X2 [Bolinopsis microptera]|uniref:acyl-CoA synthetase short-chain family member 3, mitochondrial-like isoform X2 n=1 Tax=Bolinopsis microptera TaxID=2820187 RepID=UPI003079BB16